MLQKTLSVCLGLCVLTQPLEQRLTYGVQDDTRLRRTYTGGLQLEFEQLTSIVAGQEVPAQYLPEIEMEITQSFELRIDDHLLRVEDARPLVLEREYVKGASRHERLFAMRGPFIDPLNETGGWDAASSLEGRSVRFTWDPEVDEYDTQYIGEEGPPILLEGLSEDLDWRSLLPEDALELELEEGVYWRCGPQAGRALLVPGGELHWETPEHVDERDMLRDKAEVDGTLEARIVEVDEEQGRCSIELEGELVARHVQAGDLEHVPVAEGTTTETTTTTYEVQGLLVWDLVHHHALSLRAEADVSLQTQTLKDPDQSGGDFKSTMSLRGTWEFAMEITRSGSDD